MGGYDLSINRNQYHVGVNSLSKWQVVLLPMTNFLRRYSWTGNTTSYSGKMTRLFVIMKVLHIIPPVILLTDAGYWTTNVTVILRSLDAVRPSIYAISFLSHNLTFKLLAVIRLLPPRPRKSFNVQGLREQKGGKLIFLHNLIMSRGIWFRKFLILPRIWNHNSSILF